jgi:hypothetical protein
MPYAQGASLPSEPASKLGHLTVVNNPWVRDLITQFDAQETHTQDPSKTQWTEFDPKGVLPLSNIWAVDGSFAVVQSTLQTPPKEVAFVKTALLIIDKSKLDRIDKTHPHPLLMKDILADSAAYHSTAFPLRNVRTTKGTNYDAVRHIVFDSMRVDDGGAYFETLKWLAYQKWTAGKVSSPGFRCPSCPNEIDEGFPHDAESMKCPHCKNVVFLTDMLGFHLDMSEDSAPDSVASAYMLVMETMMLFTAIRLAWNYPDPHLVENTLFIKDGPLVLSKSYSKLVPSIRSFFEYAKHTGRKLYVIGQEKTGTFVDYLSSIAKYTPPHLSKDPLRYSVLTHDYVRREVYRAPDLANPYGLRTNWGEKVFVKLEPSTSIVLSVPTGHYSPAGDFPTDHDVIGLDRILATLPSLISRKYEGALFPIELANGVASMSSYPSAKILERFLDSAKK